MDKKFKDLDRIQPHFRKEYAWGKLEDHQVLKSPWDQFERWFEDALTHQVERPNTVTLSTASKKGVPAARTMLIKGFDKKGFVFYSNYGSAKAADLAENPKAVILIYWPQLERQVRIDGRVVKLTQKETENYFFKRPRFSRIAAWASQQSRKVDKRETLDAAVDHLAKKFETKEVPLPPYWGGYRLIPSAFEFWQGRENRLNDRFLFVLNSKSGKWTRSRLYP